MAMHTGAGAISCSGPRISLATHTFVQILWKRTERWQMTAATTMAAEANGKWRQRWRTTSTEFFFFFWNQTIWSYVPKGAKAICLMLWLLYSM
jgi:hypothetical protein